MAFSEKLKNEIQQYCTNHLAPDSWYENKFSFIQDMELKNRIIMEFKAIRFAYKLYEGIEANEENLTFEVRNQILAYASIYEAVIENVLNTYYSDTEEFDALTHHTIPIKISIPQDKLNILQNALSHDGKEIVPFYYAKKKKEEAKIRFDDKCRTAEKLGLIHKFINNDGKDIDLRDYVPSDMYILTNETKLNGAACILYENVLYDFAQKLGEDLYILPSSVHEVILLPKLSVFEKDELVNMVREVNTEGVAAEEVLSDHVYEYNRTQRLITM